jgi:hypothetical protein
MAKKIQVQREKDLAEIPVLRISTTTSNNEKIAAIVKNLSDRGQARPRKLKTLANTINSLFTKKLEEQELADLMKELEQREYIAINQGKVSYTLPQ